MSSSNQLSEKTRKIVGFAAKEAPPAPSTPVWWMDLECEPSDALVLERVLRENGCTTVTISEIMKIDGKTAVNAPAQSARQTQEGIRDAAIQDHRRPSGFARAGRGQVGSAPEDAGQGR